MTKCAMMVKSVGRGSSVAMLSLLLLVLLFAFVPCQSVIADSSPTQPLLGFAWPLHEIPVLVNSSLPNASSAVAGAILTWNLAQQWFISTYMGGSSKPFLFYETNSSSNSMVTVNFNRTQTTDDLGLTTSGELHDQEGAFVKVAVAISIDLAWKGGKALTSAELQTLATHELGHALGLGHTTFSSTDLMNHVPTVMFPSTLNLYAVYLLSLVSNVNDLPQQPVTLPGAIPYETVSQGELDTVNLVTVQSATTSAQPLSQFVGVITDGPWLYLGFFIVLASAVIMVTVTGRKRRRSKNDMTQFPLIFRETPSPEEKPIQRAQLKKCQHCGSEVPRNQLICRECSMPA